MVIIKSYLCIPLDPAVLGRPGERVVLSDFSLRLLDEAWHCITGTFSDSRVSKQDKIIREQLFLNAPFYVDAKLLSTFVGILVKKDTVHGSNAKENDRGSNENAENKKGEEGIFSGKIDHLKSNVLNGLLAVDGFRGILPSNYRNYVHHLSDGKTETEKEHLAGVRAVYASSCFTDGRFSGTFAAGCVFLTLLRLYSDRVGTRMEDFVRSAANRIADNVSRFLEENDEEGDFDEEKTFEKLVETYRKRLKDDRVLEWIAFEKLRECGKCAGVKFLF